MLEFLCVCNIAEQITIKAACLANFTYNTANSSKSREENATLSDLAELLLRQLFPLARISPAAEKEWKKLSAHLMVAVARVSSSLSVSHYEHFVRGAFWSATNDGHHRRHHHHHHITGPTGL